MIAPTQRAEQILRGLALFEHVAQDELSRLAGWVQLRHVVRKAILFRKGLVCEGFHVLAYGRVKLSVVSPKGIEKPLQIVEAGGSFGDITMFLERPYYLTAEALDDCLLVYVPRIAIVRMIEHNSGFALRMLASLSMRMRNVVDDIEAFSLQPPAARLITYLMRLLPPGSITTAKIELSIQKNLVAAQLNLTPETLSRYFRELTDRGLITLDGRTVLVHDIDLLGDYVNSM